MTPVLKGEVVALRNINLDENRGEGWHRATHQTVERGSGSANPWIVASTREPQNIKLCDLLLSLGETGEAVFKFEWYTYKRGSPTT